MRYTSLGLNPGVLTTSLRPSSCHPVSPRFGDRKNLLSPQLTLFNHFFIQSHFQPRNHLISCLWRAQPLSATFLQDILSRLELQLPLRPLHYIALSRCFPRFPWFTYNSKFTSFFQHFYSLFFKKRQLFSFS